MPLVLPVFMLYMPVVLYAQQLSGYLARQLRVILKNRIISMHGSVWL